MDGQDDLAPVGGPPLPPLGQMFSIKMGADKRSGYMSTEYARDTIEQLWLQWGLEKQMNMMSISKEGVEKASPPSPPSQSQ